MSRDTLQISVTYYRKFTDSDWKDLICGLGNTGYLFSGQHLPMGAIPNDFSWQFKLASSVDMNRLLKDKIDHGEQIGLCFVSSVKSEDFTIYDSVEFSGADCTEILININGDTAKIDSCNIEDYSYYLKLFLPVFRTLSDQFSLKFSQYIDRE